MLRRFLLIFSGETGMEMKEKWNMTKRGMLRGGGGKFTEKLLSRASSTAHFLVNVSVSTVFSVELVGE